jgi:uncharacterized membrane protein (UPF0127 family)
MAREQEPTPIVVDNVTRAQTLVCRGRVADSGWTRMRGLIGSEPLEPGEGLLIVPCTSIHTLFMGFPIDVLYVNNEPKVVGIDESVVPWRTGRRHRGTRFVLELPAGTADATGTQVGDQLSIVGYGRWGVPSAENSG